MKKTSSGDSSGRDSSGRDPVEETVEETPVEETPVEETPVEETPWKRLPVEEESDDDGIEVQIVTHYKKEYYIIVGETPQYIYAIDDGDLGEKVGEMKKNKRSFIILLLESKRIFCIILLSLQYQNGLRTF